MLHANVYVLKFKALKLVRPQVDAKAYYYCRPAKSDLESSENSTNNKVSSDYIDGIRIRISGLYSSHVKMEKGTEGK